MLIFTIIVLCCSLPPGSHSLTYDGNGDYTESKVGTVTYSNLTFTLRTRQKGNVALLSVQSFNGFKVTIQDGFLKFQGATGILQGNE